MSSALKAHAASRASYS